MSVQRSEELMLDDEAVSLALKAPLAPRLEHPDSGKFRKYRLEDRLNAGVIGSMPPPAHVIRAMSPTFPKEKAIRPVFVAALLFALAAFVGAVVYRDIVRDDVAAAPAATTTVE